MTLRHPANRTAADAVVPALAGHGVRLCEMLRYLDLGTGAGFPGVPLAAYQPVGVVAIVCSATRRAARPLRPRLCQLHLRDGSRSPGIDHIAVKQARLYHPPLL